MNLAPWIEKGALKNFTLAASGAGAEQAIFVVDGFSTGLDVYYDPRGNTVAGGTAISIYAMVKNQRVLCTGFPAALGSVAAQFAVRQAATGWQVMVNGGPISGGNPPAGWGLVAHGREFG